MEKKMEKMKKEIKTQNRFYLIIAALFLIAQCTNLSLIHISRTYSCPPSLLCLFQLHFGCAHIRTIQTLIQFSYIALVCIVLYLS